MKSLRIKIFKKNHSRGFTLIEVMFGVLILVVGLVGVQQGIIACLLLNIQNSNLTIAANDAQYVMEQIKDLDYTTCIANDFAGSCYTFPTFSNLPGETITHTVVSGDRFKQVTITVRWTERQATKEYSLATYFTS